MASKTKLIRWHESRRLCNEFGSDLVSLESSDEWTALKNVIQSFPASEYFIGLKKDRSSGRWLWLSNNSSVNVSRGRTPWSPSQPSGDGECTEMYKDYRKYYGLFNDLPCTKRRGGYICERRVSCVGKILGKGQNWTAKYIGRYNFSLSILFQLSALYSTLFSKNLKVARLMTQTSSKCLRSNKTL